MRRRLGAVTGLVLIVILLGASLAADDNDVPAGAGGDATEVKEVESGGVFSWTVLRSSGLIGLIIAALAFVLLTLVIYYLLTLRRGVFVPTPLLSEVAETLKTGAARRVLEICHTDASLLSRTLVAGLSRRADGYDEMIETVETVGQEESMRLHQNVNYLALIGNIAPMLGLLGTVYGMINSFQTVADAAGSVQPARLAAGIYTALTTTLMGLIVAIPAMAAYVYFRNRVVNLMNETAVVVEELLFPFKKGGFREATGAPRPTDATKPPARKPAGPGRDQ